MNVYDGSCFFVFFLHTINAPSMWSDVPRRGQTNERGAVMKYIYVGFMVLALSTALWAQGDGDSPLCYQVVSTFDSTCNNFTNDCSIDHGCNGIFDFQASCTDYDMDAWVTPTNTTIPHNCHVCVWVTLQSDPGGLRFGECDLDVCSEHSTTKTCTGAANLIIGTWYRLHVCLSHCLSVTTCADNCIGCKGHGCIRHASQTCY
jgi:hypothetical protein